MCTNFQLDCSNSPQKSVSAKKIFSPKKCLTQKKFYPKKWVFPENCDPKNILREFNIYVKISNFLTSENLEKFLRWKFIFSSLPFPVSYNLFFLLESIKKKIKRQTFKERKQYFRILKLWEIFGKFWKMQCFRTFHTLRRVCLHIFSAIAQKLSKKYGLRIEVFFHSPSP